ncbi:HAD hydrolase-like protein [Streptomyces sp. H62]
MGALSPEPAPLARPAARLHPRPGAPSVGDSSPGRAVAVADRGTMDAPRGRAAGLRGVHVAGGHTARQAQTGPPPP